MIGIFAFTADPAGSAVVVTLGWNSAGERQATVMVPEAMARTMAAAEYEPVEEALSVPAALSYAVFLAMKARRALVITGDPAAWDPAWGDLHHIWRSADSVIASGAAGEPASAEPDLSNVDFLGQYFGTTRGRSDA